MDFPAVFIAGASVGITLCVEELLAVSATVITQENAMFGATNFNTVFGWIGAFLQGFDLRKVWW